MNITDTPAAPAAGEVTASVRAAVERSAALERQIATDPTRFRVLTGDRPTGPLHIGHYFGTLANRVRLQATGIAVFLVVADYQVVTDRERPGDIARHVRDLVLDYLAVGIRPRDASTPASDTGAATVFAHSAVPALNQLMLPFLSLVSVAELRRNPTVKAEATAAGVRSLGALLLTYPVHQAADTLFCGANLVPVGQDQLPHVEATRLVARRFNDRYGVGRAVLTEPDALLSRAPKVLGLDGEKMGKSAGNAVPLRASEEETARLVRSARTDAGRRISYDPVGRPEVANLLMLAGLCQGRAPQEVADDIGDGGAAALKAVVTQGLNDVLRPLRQRRAEFAKADDYLREVLTAGAAHARALADSTLAAVHEAMGMVYG